MSKCETLCVQIVTKRGGCERNHCNGAVFGQFILCSNFHESYQFRHNSGPGFFSNMKGMLGEEPFIYKGSGMYVTFFTKANNQFNISNCRTPTKIFFLCYDKAESRDCRSR